MLTGNFSAELNRQRVSQLQADVAHHRTVQRVTHRQRSPKQPSKPVLVVYRRALAAVALGLLLVLGLASVAFAMPVPTGPVGGSAHVPATHVSTSVQPTTGWNVWVAIALVGMTIALTTLAKRRAPVTA
ncbi:MAG: hypothetical protein M3P18_10400 [Actinomycetota bacterium]|nr:hypothetical protein [Actinomycetota bacterium]